MFVSNRAADAEQLEKRLVDSGHNGLLQLDGASIGNLCSGGAARSYLTMSTMTDPTKGLGTSRSYLASSSARTASSMRSCWASPRWPRKSSRHAARVWPVSSHVWTRAAFPTLCLRAMTNVVLRPLDHAAWSSRRCSAARP